MAACACLLLLLALSQAVMTLPAPSADDADLHQPVRVRRSLLGSVAKTILDPFNVVDRLRGGSSAHSDSASVGATLPFGISAGISASSSDAHSAQGGAASASSNAGGGGRPNNYGGAGSSASVGPACRNPPYCR